MFTEKELILLKLKIKNLIKKDEFLIVSDLDDTIFSTYNIIKEDYRKWKRWDNWNQYIIKNNLIDKIINLEYKNHKYPTIITKLLKPNKDLILTAWIKEFQEKKISALWLEQIKYIIVNKASEKIEALILYIINDLKYIPKTIIIYEDRPEYFIKYSEYIEKLLWTKIEIMIVDIKNNNKNPKIKKL